VVKKRKGARPAASRRVKKTTKKAAPRKVIAKRPSTGLENSKEVNFIPLKVQIRAHIRRLSSYPDPSPAIQKTLDSLRQVQATLSSECSPTMVIPTP
jgi:hypothetical protein